MLKLAPILAASAALTGCVISNVSLGPTQYESKFIERDKAETARVKLNMGAGDLKVSSGTEKFLSAHFTYNVPQYKPEVRYSCTGGVADLTVDEPSSHGHIGNMKYEWDLRLTKELPLDLDVNFGAGEAHLDIGSLDLRRVSLQMGVGQLEMDLRGSPKHDYSVDVHGGVGEANIKLPAGVGIEATASGGIGDISVHGLRKESGRWINEAYNKPGPKVRVTVEGGIGQIRLTAE